MEGRNLRSNSKKSPASTSTISGGFMILYLPTFLRLTFQLLLCFLFVCFLFIISFADKPTANPAAVFDFDGDGKTDFVIERGVASGEFTRKQWWILNSRDNTSRVLYFGTFGGLGYRDDPIPADYDGDGKWDIAVFRYFTVNPQSYFYILRSSDNTLQVIPWGLFGDFPNKTQDFDGDGKADPTVTRVTNGLIYWYTLLSKTNTPRITQFGMSRSSYITDIPLRGDFDGDGKADLAVYRRNLYGTRINIFIILQSSDGKIVTQKFGRYQTYTTAITGDFDGDGKTDIGYFHNPSGNGYETWYWRRSSDQVEISMQFGEITDLYGDSPAHGDYDGDGKTDVAVWRYIYNSTCFFYVNRSRDGLLVVPWGYGRADNNVNSLVQTDF
jgi:hypothetical protein